MSTLAPLVLIVSLLNVLLFSLAARFTFDARSAGTASKAFVGAFLTLFGLAVFHLFAYESQSVLRLALSLALLLCAMSVFVGAWLSILHLPLTVVFSPDIPRHMLTTGVYRYVRHPFYSSYIATFVAMAIACDHSICATCAVAIAALYVGAALFEERKFARSTLAVAYERYRQQAGMFWPKPFAGATTKRASAGDVQ